MFNRGLKKIYKNHLKLFYDVYIYIMIDITKNIVDSILDIIEEEKTNFSKEQNYIIIMNLLMEQKKQIDLLRINSKIQKDIINHLEYGI